MRTSKLITARKQATQVGRGEDQEENCHPALDHTLLHLSLEISTALIARQMCGRPKTSDSSGVSAIYGPRWTILLGDKE
jgi:hypothetical protein